MSNVSILSNLLMRNSTIILSEEDAFPLNPIFGQFCFKDGILFIYASINTIDTWYPLTNKTISYTHVQGVVSSTWTCIHNLGTSDVIFMVYDNEDNLNFPSSQSFPDGNSIVFTFDEAIKGKAIIFAVPDQFGITFTSMFSKSGDDIIFNGNLVPASNETWSIGDSLRKIKDLYISANTIYVGDTTVFEGTGITVNAGTNPSELTANPTITASKFIAKPFSYNPGTGSITVRPSIEFQDNSGNSYPISFDTVNNKFSLDALGDYGQGSLVCKNIDGSGKATVYNFESTTDAKILGNLRVDGNSTLGYDSSDTITIRGSVDLLTPITFGQAATLGDGNDTIAINGGMANNFTVISRNMQLDSSGNLTIIGSLTATGGLNTNAPTATKLANARSISLGGSLSGSANFDGSQNITITASVSDDSHNHVISNIDDLQTALDNKLNTSGGTISSDLIVTGNLTVNGTTTTVNTQNLVITDNEIVLNKNETGEGVAVGSAGIRIERGLLSDALLKFDESADAWYVGIEGNLKEINKVVIGDVTGLQTALNGKAASSHSHAGTDITSVVSSATDSDTLDTLHAASFARLDANSSPSIDNNFTLGDITHRFSNIYSTTFTGALVGNASTSSSCTGNAATTTKLQTSRTISLTGGVTGSTSFDGSGNVSITSTVEDDSHNHVISNVDGLQTALNGKASSSHSHAGTDITSVVSSATKLETARNINGVAFDGTQNITITAEPTTHNHSLDSLSNVTIVSNSPNEILKWTGSTWVNSTLSESNIVSTTDNVLPLTHGNSSSITAITSTVNSDQVIDTVSATTYRTVKYIVQISSNSAFQSTELLITHDDSATFMTEYSTIRTTGTNLAVFTSDINSGNIRLLVTPTNAVTTIKAIRIGINS